jgi:hypothetical protein
MAVKLIDLQLIYGIAGAQGKFDHLVSQLVKREQPDADNVRIEHGDGGVDVFVGDLAAPEGIDVYQCKFFPRGLGDSQKEQIRKSYRTCRDSTHFKTKRWTLCLPVDLSIQERKWFEEWRHEHAADAIHIENPWDATRLEGLLYQEKNTGLIEAFFKQEYLTQIREMHGMMQALVDRVNELVQAIQADQEKAKATDARLRQAHYAEDFFKGCIQHHAELLDECTEHVRGKQPSYWHVLIRPSRIPDRPRLESLRECSEAVRACQVGQVGWRLPETTNMEHTGGQEWFGGDVKHSPVESWRLSQKGLFAYATTIPNAAGASQISQPRLSIDVAVAMMTLVFRFAAKLSDKVFDPNDGTVETTIRWTNILGRPLHLDRGSLRRSYSSNVPELENTWRCPREVLRTEPDRLAREATLWFFERFNWQYLSEEMVTDFQKRILPYI